MIREESNYSLITLIRLLVYQKNYTILCIYMMLDRYSKTILYK